MSSRALLLTALALAAGPALAIRPPAHDRDDAKRFGFDKLERPAARKRAPAAAARTALSALNEATVDGQWTLKSDGLMGSPLSLTGGKDAPRRGTPDEAARSFLRSQSAILGIDEAALAVTRESKGAGHKHVLYEQRHRGIPVEGAKVKVHLDAQGAVMGVDSRYEPALDAPTTPAIAAADATRAAEADAGQGKARGAPELVILPMESTGKSHLAWKVKVDGPMASWRYYVDAITGQVLLRYNNLRFAVCLTSGVVQAEVFDVDPTSTPGPVVRALNNQWVYVADGSTRAVTGGDPIGGPGFFCSGVTGKVSMSLQGPYVSVAQFRGPSAHYDNGSGVWSTVGTPVSSPHPYQNSSVHVSTIDLTIAAPNAVKFLPVFTSFRVGGFTGFATETADITDDDQLFIYDGYGDPIASWVGNRGQFNGAAVHGKRMHIALRSNAQGTDTGYDVLVSSYLSLTSPFSHGTLHSSHTWRRNEHNNLRGELSLFYHLNQMHDYFFNDVNRSSAAPVTKPVVAMAHVGPNLVNAFYNPDYDNLYFGDVNSEAPNDLFMEDATVTHHEYVHYLVEKIWSIQNYGQGGAVSEAIADYFSASSLNEPAIGRFVVSGLGGTGALRHLDCAIQAPCKVLSAASWSGQIHDDSIFLSQALWDIRKDRIATLGAANGRSCADGLVFQSLLFFPESFREFYDAMLRVDSLGTVTACGGAGSAQGIISTAFSAHGLLVSGGDGYEPNDGFSTAVDVSTLSAVSATVFPAGDIDFYSFGAGAGLVEVTLNLPSAGASAFKHYMLKLYDRSRRELVSVAPPYDGFGTIDGICDTSDCSTSASRVVLRYNNPTGGLLYLAVLGGESLNGSNSGVNSTDPYSFTVSFPKAGALSGSIVSARFDQDTISFSVDVSSFVSNQDWRFNHAQLRNQSFALLENTATHPTTLPGDMLSLVSASNAQGRITGQVRLVPGFASRFPSVGTVYLEVFGYNVHLSTPSSLGLSNPINLTASEPAVKAFNNAFNPARGEKATIKYATMAAGRVSVKLYTVTGRYVATLFEGDVTAGKGSLDWDGRNLSGAVVASGVYVVKVEGPGVSKTTKVAIIK